MTYTQKLVLLAGLGVMALSATGGAACRHDAAELIYLPAGNDSAQNPAYSPDGQTLLFTVFHRGYNVGDAGLFTLPVVGGLPTAVLDQVGHAAVNLPSTSWNAVNGRITFSSDRIATDEVWTANPDGTGLVQVTVQAAPLVHYQEPSFSPDGMWIVFEAVGSNDLGSLWKVRADGTQLTLLLDETAAGSSARQPNWSPLGDKIVFQRTVANAAGTDLCTIAPDGSALTLVTTGFDDTDVSWSPDGHWLVFSSNRGDPDVGNLWIVSAAGGTPVRVTDDELHEDGAASWSPDGHWIAFESHIATPEQPPAGLWRVRVPWPFGTTCSPAGSPCDDANPCTTGDQCQAGVCAGTPNTGGSCDDRNPCTQSDQCVAGVCQGSAQPFLGCRLPVTAHQASVDLRNKTPDTGDQFKWNWKRGAATTVAEFGNPLTSTGYTLCVFDSTGGTPTVAMAESIAPGAGWRAAGTGFSFSGAGTAVGAVKLKAGAAGIATIGLKGKGVCSGVPTLPLTQSPTVRVQLSNGTTCWEADYGTHALNTADRFKARAD